MYNFQYDAASQLVEALQSGAATNTYEYAYDAAGNRLSERTNAVVEGSTYNNVNELTNRSGGGSMRFRGSVNEPISNATVAGSVAILDLGTNFTGYATVGAGSNTVQVEVSDYNGNTVANYYSIVLSNGTSQTLTYDLNGNLVTITNTTTGASISNVWDAANRLVAIYSNSTYRSLFAYDGMGRRVRQTETTNGVTKSDNWMLWCDTQLCEKRDSTGGVVSNRFFAQGEQITGTNYFFTRDHLGSIREMTDSSGTIQARYTYDPWGRRTKVSGNLDADFGFTGHYYHAPSGLHLALYRAYSADLGRWLSRDPLYEEGGNLIVKWPSTGDRRSWAVPHGVGMLMNAEQMGFVDAANLYTYAVDNPLRYFDALGLKTQEECLQDYENRVFKIGAEKAGSGILGLGIGIICVGVGLGVGAANPGAGVAVV